MFDSFGIMTTEELNELANNLKNEGDKESIKALASGSGSRLFWTQRRTISRQGRLLTARPS